MSGHNFVFMHGGGQGSWAWDETIAALALQSGGACRTLALDAPGCGTKRGRDTGAIGFDDIVAELIADIEASGMQDVILVGHSQAGSVMPRMAEQRPDLFRRLIFASCSSPLQGQTIPEMIGKGLQGAHPDEVGWYVDPATTTVEQRYRATFCHDMGEEQALRLLDAMSRDLWPMSSYTQRHHPGQLYPVPARPRPARRMAAPFCRTLPCRQGDRNRRLPSGDDDPPPRLCRGAVDRVGHRPLKVSRYGRSRHPCRPVAAPP